VATQLQFAADRWSSWNAEAALPIHRTIAAGAGKLNPNARYLTGIPVTISVATSPIPAVPLPSKQRTTIRNLHQGLDMNSIADTKFAPLKSLVQILENKGLRSS
jgi:hypothetical protein